MTPETPRCVQCRQPITGYYVAGGGLGPGEKACSDECFYVYRDGEYQPLEPGEKVRQI